MIGSGGSPGTSGDNLNLASADDPESAAHGHSSSPQPRNDMNTTLDQATLYDKVVTIFISHAVHQHVMKIVDSLSEGNLDEHKMEYYSTVVRNVGCENLRNLRQMLRQKGFPEKMEEGECLCLGTFYAQSNDTEEAWGKRKIKSVFGDLPKGDFPRALFRESKYRTPKYKEVDAEFYQCLPRLDGDGQLVTPQKPLREWTIDDDSCERIDIYVKDKKDFKSTLHGEHHFTPNDIWRSFLRELRKDECLPPLNQVERVTDDESDDASSSSSESSDSDNDNLTSSDDDSHRDSSSVSSDYEDGGRRAQDDGAGGIRRLWQWLNDSDGHYIEGALRLRGLRRRRQRRRRDDGVEPISSASESSDSDDDNDTSSGDERRLRRRPQSRRRDDGFEASSSSSESSDSDDEDVVRRRRQEQWFDDSEEDGGAGALLLRRLRRRRQRRRQNGVVDASKDDSDKLRQRRKRQRTHSGVEASSSSSESSDSDDDEVVQKQWFDDSDEDGVAGALPLRRLRRRRLRRRRNGGVDASKDDNDKDDGAGALRRHEASSSSYDSEDQLDNNHLIVSTSEVYDDRKSRKGEDKDKISLSAFELIRAMMVMSAADCLRACHECFELIQEENDKEPKLKAVPLKPYELGTVLRMFPNPNPSRVTNVKADTLIQTILQHADEDYSDEDDASKDASDKDDGAVALHPRRQRRRRDNGVEASSSSSESSDSDDDDVVRRRRQKQWFDDSDEDGGAGALPLRRLRRRRLRRRRNGGVDDRNNVGDEGDGTRVLRGRRQSPGGCDDGARHNSVDKDGRRPSRYCARDDGGNDGDDENDNVEDGNGGRRVRRRRQRQRRNHDDGASTSSSGRDGDGYYDNNAHEDGGRPSSRYSVRDGGGDDDRDQGDGQEENDSADSDSQSRPTYPLHQRLSLENNEVDERFCSIVFQCVQACLTCNPAATGMYQREYAVPVQYVIPDPDHLDTYLQFVKESRKFGSKFSHHRNNQYTEAVPEKVRKDSKSYKTFITNLAHNFGDKFRSILEKSKTENGDKCDRKEVLFNFAKLLAACCSGTKFEEWIFIANQAISDVHELYEGEPLGEATRHNIPIAYGSTKGVQYLNRVPKTPGKKKKSRRNQKKRTIKIYFLADVISEEEGKEIFQELNSLSDIELGVLLYFRNKNGAICSMYNGRPFGWVDVEHWDCKVYHVAKGRSNGWQVTLKPNFTKPYCRPFKHNNKIFECSPELESIFRWASTCFYELTSKNMLCTPSSLLFKEERENLKDTLSNMKKLEENEDRHRNGFIYGWSQYNIACGFSSLPQ